MLQIADNGCITSHSFFQGEAVFEKRVEDISSHGHRPDSHYLGISCTVVDNVFSLAQYLFHQLKKYN